MKYLQHFDDPSEMTATSSTPEQPAPSTSTSTVDSLNLTSLHIQPGSDAEAKTSPSDEFVHISPPSPSSNTGDSSSSPSPPSTASMPDDSKEEKKARLVFCKSHVSIHPTQFNKDNISGYLGIVEVDSDGYSGMRTDEEGKVHIKGKVKEGEEGQAGSARDTREMLVTWIPNELLEMMEGDREGYQRVEGRTQSVGEKEEDGYVFVSIPPPRGEKYAFSVPVAGVYSILVYPPSLTHWYGSATFNLTGGVSLPTLFFHDDETPPLLTSSTNPANTQQPPPRPQWGFPPFVNVLQSHATLLRSRLVTPKHNQGGELWLINPSKSDREVHEMAVEEPVRPRPTQPGTANTGTARPKPVPSTPAGDNYPPRATLPDFRVLGNQTPKQTLMSGLSNITNFSRKAAQQVLSHPFAEPLLPKLPPAVKSFVNVQGEWERSGLPPKAGKNSEVATEFEAARLYLARWARVVAEEGERARKKEVAGRSNLSAGERIGAEDLASSLGVFSLLTNPNSKRPIPQPTRTPEHPITSRDWDSFAAQGRDELYVRREIFKRGFSDSPEEDEKRTRREGWEVLLGTVSWATGGVGGGEIGREKRRKNRAAMREAKRESYEHLKESWLNEVDSTKKEEWRDEWHRIDVDCRRTDRNQALYAVPTEAVEKGEEEKEAGGAGSGWDGKGEEEEGGAAKLNPHIAALRSILMTYHTYLSELGYVQGMSDLLSPIYIVFDANEADAFWGLVGVMQIMETNFLRDQSGMKRQLSTLQQLIGVMDPELYAHLERTESLNLFFCFRWILIAFKREFKFDDVIRLWEVLWTNYYSDHFVLFIALAILQSHRDVLLRYLTEFDEVLKYANDLSGTIDLNTTLAQAEVLFLSFKGMVGDLEQENAVSDSEGTASTGMRRRRRSSAGGGIKEAGKGKGRLSFEMRELLDCWRPSGLT